MMFYYVNFISQGMVGATVVKQNDSPDGLNIAAAQEWLIGAMQGPAVITNYIQITEKRHAQYRELMTKIMGSAGAPGLTVHQGGIVDGEPASPASGDQARSTENRPKPSLTVVDSGSGGGPDIRET